MKCLILVGGYGTRLRPLTLSMPKSLVPFCNMPIVEHQIKAAAAAGVTHVILAVGYQPGEMLESLAELEERYSIRITCSIEKSPLGTAGPLHLAREELVSDPEPFFVFNSDVICEFPLQEMLAFHRSHGGLGTLCVTPVTEPSKYGVVQHDSGKISAFVEKPQVYVGNEINAGLYLLSKSVVDRVGPKFMMFEKDVFPQMASEGKLFCYPLKGYWADIGQPVDYLKGMVLHLEALEERKKFEIPKPSVVSDEQIDSEHVSSVTGCSPTRKLSPFKAQRITLSHDYKKAESPVISPTIIPQTYTIIPPVVIHPTACIGTGAVVGPHVTLGPGSQVGDFVRVKNSAIFDNVKIGDGAWVDGSIIGWKSKIGKWAKLGQGTVLGENVEISEGVFLNGIFVLPHKSIKDNILEKAKVIM